MLPLLVMLQGLTSESAAALGSALAGAASLEAVNLSRNSLGSAGALTIGAVGICLRFAARQYGVQMNNVY